MYRFVVVILAALILLGGAGCKKKEPKLYEGLSLEIWLERVQSDDPAERADALGVIAKAGRDAAYAEEDIRELARNDPYPDIQLKAIAALDSMGSPTAEFQDLINRYTQEFEPDTTALDEDFDEVEAGFEGDEDKYSTEQDIMALKELTSTAIDSPDLSLFPKDIEDVQRWEEEKINIATDNLLNQLHNPRVLLDLLEGGETTEREYALKSLAKMSGENSEIVEALTKLSNDPDKEISALAKAALQNWREP